MSHILHYGGSFDNYSYDCYPILLTLVFDQKSIICARQIGIHWLSQPRSVNRLFCFSECSPEIWKFTTNYLANLFCFRLKFYIFSRWALSLVKKLGSHWILLTWKWKHEDSSKSIKLFIYSQWPLHWGMSIRVN